MSILRILALGVLLAMPAEAAEPVAIVYSLAGEASLTAPDHRPLHLLDRLPEGTTIEVGAGSRLALALVNGLRYELGGRARVTLGPRDLVSRTGPVRPLPRLPPLPPLSPIAAEDRPGHKAGAVRIRAERIPGLYPRRGAAVLDGEILLRFRPVMAARMYRIEVWDEQGQAVLRADVEAPPATVLAGTLRAGRVYRWTVRTLDRPGAVARGEAELAVLDEEAARRREKACGILEPEKPGSLPLLAEIDRSLGLLIEARESLRQALADSPGDPGLLESLAGIEAQLEHDDDHN